MGLIIVKRITALNYDRARTSACVSGYLSPAPTHPTAGRPPRLEAAQIRPRLDFAHQSIGYLAAPHSSQQRSADVFMCMHETRGDPTNNRRTSYIIDTFMEEEMQCKQLPTFLTELKFFSRCSFLLQVLYAFAEPPSLFS